MAERNPRQAIEQMVEDWGSAFPGVGMGLPLYQHVKSNLPMIVSVFGLLAHAHASGEMTFKNDEQREEIAIAMESLLKLCSSTGIEPAEWDDQVNQLRASTLMLTQVDGFDA